MQLKTIVEPSAAAVALLISARPIWAGPVSRRLVSARAGSARASSGRDGRRPACARFAGVAQLVEHRFCKPKVKGSSPLASSEKKSSRAPLGLRLVRHLEGCPSGQREQAVNLPASASVGSNPTPSTAVCLRPDEVVLLSEALLRGEAQRSDLAGVAQLVERQPSKLNVAGSTPVSRSLVGSGQKDPAPLAAGTDFALSGVFRARGAHSSSAPSGTALSGTAPSGSARVAALRDRHCYSRWQPSAHIAQVVERVLGKDEVTSSNLVVGSRGLFAGAVLARTAPVASRS
jgi:hypothetical protein